MVSLTDDNSLAQTHTTRTMSAGPKLFPTNPLNIARSKHRIPNYFRTSPQTLPMSTFGSYPYQDSMPNNIRLSQQEIAQPESSRSSQIEMIPQSHRSSQIETIPQSSSITQMELIPQSRRPSQQEMTSQSCRSSEHEMIPQTCRSSQHEMIPQTKKPSHYDVLTISRSQSPGSSHRKTRMNSFKPKQKSKIPETKLDNFFSNVRLALPPRDLLLEPQNVQMAPQLPQITQCKCISLSHQQVVREIDYRSTSPPEDVILPSRPSSTYHKLTQQTQSNRYSSPYLGVTPQYYRSASPPQDLILEIGTVRVSPLCQRNSTICSLQECVPQHIMQAYPPPPPPQELLDSLEQMESPSWDPVPLDPCNSSPSRAIQSVEQREFPYQDAVPSSPSHSSSSRTVQNGNPSKPLERYHNIDELTDLQIDLLPPKREAIYETIDTLYNYT